jgi:ubiquinone/menaquinone biosynthesis C-methylase UbiE
MPELKVATKQNIEKVFDDNAAEYDRVGPAVFRHFGARLVDWLSPTQGTKLLDIATGNGAVLLPAARLLAPHGHVTGIDLSGGILRQAKVSARAEGLTNVELRKMDAEHLEFPDQTFDFVTCGFSLFFFPNMETALREMRRVCKVGGWLGLTVFDRTPPPFDPVFPTLMQQFGSYEGKVWMPPHGMSLAPKELDVLLSKYEFQTIKTHSEVGNFIYNNEEEIWAFFPLRLALLDADERALAQFKEQFLAKLRPLFRPDGLHMSVAAAFAKGQR